METKRKTDGSFCVVPLKKTHQRIHIYIYIYTHVHTTYIHNIYIYPSLGGLYASLVCPEVTSLGRVP